MVKPLHHSHRRWGGKPHSSKGRAEWWMLGSRTRHAVSGRREKELQEEPSLQWNTAWVCLCDCVDRRHLSNLTEWTAFQWHSPHSFLWVSSQRVTSLVGEERRRRRGGGSSLPSTFFFPLSHNPTHIWKREEGNPRWWLKCFSAAVGKLSAHLFRWMWAVRTLKASSVEKNVPLVQKMIMWFYARQKSPEHQLYFYL